MGIMDEFDPSTDGWSFENWGEQGDFCIGSCEFSWDLYQQAYLGINQTQDCVVAPLDCAFYEIFKKCAEQGNCGGMSVLALAVLKYGGYMGFCSPASFYRGTKSPPNWKCTDREDLHRAINILQARQFSAHGIENFLDVVDAGNLNNANEAFQKANELLRSGDYPVLSIANDTLGAKAHTVIPFKVEDNPPGYQDGTHVMHIWDPNHPYAKEPSHYSGTGPGTPFHLVINPRTNTWSYTSAGTAYPGTTGWCFIVPISAVLPKSRQPMALDMVFDALMTVFVTGPGAAVTQVSDGAGHRLYTSTGEHVLRSDLETDPELRLKGVGRWPWPAQTEQGTLPGELYFMRRSLGDADLEFTISGSQYKLMTGVAGNLLEVEITSARPSVDAIRISRLAAATRSVEVHPLERTRTVSLRQLRAGLEETEWRSVELRNAQLGREGLVLSVPGDLEAVELHSRGRAMSFDMELLQRREGQLQRRPLGRLSTVRGKTFRVEPSDWRDLEKSEIHTGVKKRPAAR